MFSAVDVVRSVAHYAVTYGRNHSSLGRNLLFCMNRYKCSLLVCVIYLGLILVEFMVLLLREFLTIVQLVVCNRLTS